MVMNKTKNKGGEVSVSSYKVIITCMLHKYVCYLKMNIDYSILGVIRRIRGISVSIDHNKIKGVAVKTHCELSRAVTSSSTPRFQL